MSILTLDSGDVAEPGLMHRASDAKIRGSNPFILTHDQSELQTTMEFTSEGPDPSKGCLASEQATTGGFWAPVSELGKGFQSLLSYILCIFSRRRSIPVSYREKPILLYEGRLLFNTSYFGKNVNGPGGCI